MEHDSASNLLSLLGGKWTTYRLMAKDAVDAVCDLLGVQAECRTEAHRLVGAEGFDSGFWKKNQAEYGFETDISQHLTQKYGSRANRVGELAKQRPELAERLLPDFPFIKAEVVHAVREEMACSVRDFLARRIRLEITDWQATKAAIPVVAKLMGKTLGWSSEEISRQQSEYLTQIEGFETAVRGDTRHS